MAKAEPEKWSELLGTVSWRCCSVCNVSPLDVWKKSGAWDLFHTAKTAMMKVELASQKNVVLDLVTNEPIYCYLLCLVEFLVLTHTDLEQSYHNKARVFNRSTLLKMIFIRNTKF